MRIKNLTFSQLLSLFVLALVILFSESVVFAWTGPTATPPAGNVAAPINVGSTFQTKSGGIGVTDLTVAASGHVNFGATSGDSGYGIRDGAGTVQYKNSGGTWSNFPVSVWTVSGNDIYNSNSGNVLIGTTANVTLSGGSCYPNFGCGVSGTPIAKLNINGWVNSAGGYAVGGTAGFPRDAAYHRRPAEA